MRLSAESHHLLQKRLRAVLRPGEILLCACSSTLIFAAVYYCKCFSVRYTSGAVASLGVILPFLISLGAVLLAVHRYRTHKMSRSWIAVAVVLPACFLTGEILGERYWLNSMVQYHTWRDMASYVNIDPDRDKGQSYMDAGTVYFKEGSYVMRNHTVSFHNGLTYCVAPIVRAPIDREPGSEVLQTTGGFVLPRSGTVDFWAVGTNCCDGTKTFDCGDVNSHMARSGMRVLNEVSRSMYVLGVQEWSASTGLPVRHPLFFTWVRDPILRAENMKEDCSVTFMTRTTTCFFTALMAAFAAHAVLQKMHIH